ncbi:MAG: diacylglycerol kinase family protein [Planctomycetaceae bacterium]|nr:diacylglycerol kinase family protein [Planctomycetaceae bacterium]
MRNCKRVSRLVTRTPFERKERTWANKFKNAFVGLWSILRRQSSYHVHFVAAIFVIVAAFLIGNFDTVRWSIIVICIALVLTTEMLNTSIESLAKAITTNYDPKIGLALDISSGAVLFVSFGAAVVGIILFTESILKLLDQ